MMTKTQRNITALSMIILVSALGTTSHASTVQRDGKHYVKTDRYTLVSLETTPEQLSPLLAVTKISFSQHIHSVGQAVNELLVGSGYTWDVERGSVLLNNLELPQIVRDIGPVRLRDALITVTGEAWNMQVDELSRTIWFTPKDTAL